MFVPDYFGAANCKLLNIRDLQWYECQKTPQNHHLGLLAPSENTAIYEIELFNHQERTIHAVSP